MSLTAARPVPGPVRRVLGQAWFETRVILGNGEQLVISIVLPLMALVALVHLTWIPLPVAPGQQRVDVAVPGVLAIAVISTAFTGQAIATAFDRRNGVLRLLGTTPLGRGGLLAGRLLAVCLVEVAQMVLFAAAGVAMGWRAELGMLPVTVLLVLLGTAAFLALGLLLGGTVRPEGVLAVANLGWVVLVGAGGVLLPAAPGRHAQVMAWLPSGALGDGLRAAFVTGQIPLFALGVLAFWAVLLSLLASRFFRWD